MDSYSFIMKQVAEENEGKTESQGSFNSLPQTPEQAADQLVKRQREAENMQILMGIMQMSKKLDNNDENIQACARAINELCRAMRVAITEIRADIATLAECQKNVEKKIMLFEAEMKTPWYRKIFRRNNYGL